MGGFLVRLCGMEKPITKEAPSLWKMKTLILTPEQYVEHPWVKEHPPGSRSYAYALEQDGKILTVFGSEHINDPKDPLFEKIKALVAELKPDYVMVEGMQQLSEKKEHAKLWVEGLSEEAARRKGEPMYTLKLAVDSGADFESPEPSGGEELRHLEAQGLSRESILKLAIYQLVPQFVRSHPTSGKRAFEEYLYPYMERFKKDCGWEPAQFEELRSRIVADIDITNPDKYAHLVDPMPYTGSHVSEVNEVSAANTMYRDNRIFDRIAEVMKTHSRVLVVYGSGHAVSLEPALRALMDNPQGTSK